MEVKDIWNKALEYVKAEINSNVSFTTYIEPAVPIYFDDDVFTIAVEISLGKMMIEKHHKDLIEKSLSRIVGQAVKLEVCITKDAEALKKELAQPKKSSAPPEKGAYNSSYINPKSTFDNFVVGNSNNYAYNVALAVAKTCGGENNPLFIYGNSGLGKTHLMLAIGNYVLQNHPELRVTYVTSERFTNEMISALKDDNMLEFKNRYRNTDYLLVDDIQFIEGKDGIQEEFFHTFNALYDENKQIVITSDRTPRELVTIEERLRTRFQCGNITDIGVPEYETRMAILKKKAESANIEIKDEVFNYIAERVNTNVRELEGALGKIIAYSRMSKDEIDIHFAEESLKRILPDDKIIKITHKEIKEKVCTYYNVSLEELTGNSRTKDVATARQVAMYLCKKLTDMNHVRIGIEFGNKDRTTVTHNVKKISKDIETSPEIKGAVESITRDLRTI